MGNEPTQSKARLRCDLRFKEQRLEEIEREIKDLYLESDVLEDELRIIRATLTAKPVGG